MSYSDSQITRQLEMDGMGLISNRQVAKIRKRIGFVRRMTVWECEAADKKLKQLVQKELDSREIEGYGRNLLNTWFCIKGENIS